MKYTTFIILLFFSSFIISQEKFSKEISLVTDNDLYVSTIRDRYYTSGIFLTYRYLSKQKKEHLEKRIFEWQIGHEMYTPYVSTVPNISFHDRPFAGYLYGGFNVKRIYKNHQIFKTSLRLGFIGPNAFGKELQEFIHNIYGFKKAIGWEYQIKNALALNLGAQYLKRVVKTEKDNFDISWVNQVNIGTVYTNVSSGFYSRFGFKPLQSLANSIAFGTNINDENTRFKREVESFIYVKPTVQYAFYDATLQGSFLNTSSSVVTKEIIPLIFNIEFGILFTAHRFNFGYSFMYNTSKSKDLRYGYGHKYGRISINYLLR